MGYPQLNRRYPRGVKGSRILSPIEQALSQRGQGVQDLRVRVTRSEASALNANELQRLENLVIVIRTLFRHLQDNWKILETRLIRSGITVKGKGCS